jgi:hypothetical protein
VCELFWRDLFNSTNLKKNKKRKRHLKLTLVHPQNKWSRYWILVNSINFFILLYDKKYKNLFKIIKYWKEKMTIFFNKNSTLIDGKKNPKQVGQSLLFFKRKMTNYSSPLILLIKKHILHCLLNQIMVIYWVTI